MPKDHIEHTALVSLSECYIHPMNARSEPPAEDIETLADSIAELGLLQNLAGFADPLAPADLAAQTGIVAGGRRLRALCLLAQRDGRNPEDVTIPVKITTDEATARLWASAENTARQGLHPADEVRAYGRMAGNGADVNRIARAFAVTERHVKQRLKLSTLPSAALDALRANEISLDQAGALTSARDDTAMMAELTRAKGQGWGTSADQIRERLRGDSITAADRRAIFVGLDAYRDNDGQVQESLFTDQTLLMDGSLLNDLFTAKLAELAHQEQQSGGWKWVKTLEDAHPDWNLSSRLDRIHRTAVDLPDADLDELAELTDRAETEELSPADLARMEELETRAAGDYSDEDRATSGLWLFVDCHGELAIHGPFRDPKDDPHRAPAEADGTDGDTTTPTASRALPANLVEDLNRIRLAALQLKAADSYELMLDLLAYQLAGGLKPYSPALNISVTPANIAPEKPEGTALPDRLQQDAIEHGKETLSPGSFAAFRALGKKHRNDALARSLARLIPTNDLAPALARQIGADVRSIWTPTKSGYLGRLPSPVLDMIWADLVPNDRTPDHATFQSYKKAEKADLLHHLFQGFDLRESLALSRDQNARIDTWLPAELQWPSTDETEET